MTNETAIELLNRVNEIVEKRMKWLSEDKKDELVSIIVGILFRYKPSEKYPAPLPNDAYIEKIMRWNASNPDNFILAGNKKIKIEKNGELVEVNCNKKDKERPDELISYEQYNEATGWEPSCQSVEQVIIERSERSVQENMIANCLKSPFFAGILKDAINHVNNGGTFLEYAESINMSADTLKNKIKSGVEEINSKNQFLPFQEITITTKPIVKKTNKIVVKSGLQQLSLF